MHLAALLITPWAAGTSAKTTKSLPIFWIVTTSFSFTAAIVSEVLAYRARKVGKQDRYEKYRYAATGLWALGSLELIRTLLIMQHKIPPPP